MEPWRWGVREVVPGKGEEEGWGRVVVVVLEEEEEEGLLGGAPRAMARTRFLPMKILEEGREERC